MIFYVTGLLDFTLVCGEIRNLKAREVVLGYDLSEEEEQILSRQMNLVLSYEKEGFEDLHLLDSRLAAVEQAASSKTASVCSSDSDEGIEPPQACYPL